jgi:hypothetical protein
MHGEISLYTTMGANEVSCKDALKSEWYEFYSWITALVHSIDLHGRRVHNHVLTLTYGLLYRLRGS